MLVFFYNIPALTLKSRAQESPEPYFLHRPSASTSHNHFSPGILPLSFSCTSITPAFPDAVTARGTKHLRELELMVQQGHRAVIFFCVQREDIHSVRAAEEIDPLYAKTLKQVAESGVEVLAYGAQFLGEDAPTGIELTRKLAVII